MQAEKERKMNITEGSYYEKRDGKGYVYVNQRDHDLVAYIICSKPTKEALSASNTGAGITTKQEIEEMIVYPYCDYKDFTAWAEIPMDIHECCSIRSKISHLTDLISDLKCLGFNSEHKEALSAAEELYNIINGILDRGDADEYEENEGEEEDEA